MTDDARWFARRTAHAPDRLLERATEMLAGTPESLPMAERLASAGRGALSAAAAAGTGRTAALDLLAADALITLALLATAERNPAALGETARALRLGGIE